MIKMQDGFDGMRGDFQIRRPGELTSARLGDDSLLQTKRPPTWRLRK
jgi:hypothetical protein